MKVFTGLLISKDSMNAVIRMIELTVKINVLESLFSCILENADM
jgi:hypothetical protein